MNTAGKSEVDEHEARRPGHRRFNRHRCRLSDRFAHRGDDLVLVARNAAAMAAVAERLTKETGVTVDVLPADLTDPQDLAGIGRRRCENAGIGVLVSNAGAAISAA